MGTLAIALVLFGCSDDLAQCVEVREEAYATKSQCEAASRSLLMSEVALSADYPTMTAMCMSAGKARLMRGKTQDFSGDWR